MIEDKIYNYFERNEHLHVLFIFDPSGMKGEELAAARRKLKETYTICRPEKEDLAPLSARERFWPSLARLSLFGTARLKNLLRRGL